MNGAAAGQTGTGVLAGAGQGGAGTGVREAPAAGQPAQVQPLEFPLHGSRLIEASAGTGKTFTIAALYLRLVLGHGGGQAHARPLDPPEILVVTFTEAATLELRDRIRRRLAEGARFFLAGAQARSAAPAGEGSAGMPDGGQGDDFLQALRASYPASDWPACAARLQLAAEWMDEAAVSTIHGWCSRMLREHAFDSGALFSLKPVEDDAGLLAEAMRDYWRSFVQQMDAGEARLFSIWWTDFGHFSQALQADIGQLLAVDADAMPPAGAVAALQAQLAGLKADWRNGEIDELERRLLEAIRLKHVSGNLCRKKTVELRMADLRRWVADAQAVLPVDEKGEHWFKPRSGSGSAADWLLKWCSQESMANPGLWKQNALCEHPVFPAAEALIHGLSRLEGPKGAVLLHAARWVDARHHRARAQRGELGFDDMLQQLDHALQSSGGEVLAGRIRQQFPVALIDEFQDTDPLQYRIFDRVYCVADPQPDTALVLIGDPKQAIYAFRNADIHTYLRARAATRGRHYTLDTNYRSAQAMVDVVNYLFSAVEQRPGSGGAFRFGQGESSPLPFRPVLARGRGDSWQDAAWPPGKTPALTIWQPAPDEAQTRLSKGRYEQRLADATASEIARLLRDGQQAQGGFGNQPVKPADMAVLVNTGQQAQRVRQALRRLGIASVYLSDKASVYQNALADDLLRCLAACAEPGQGAWLREALATRLLGLPLAALMQLQQDEACQELQLARFQRYRQVWRQRGVLPMIRLLVQEFGVAERLLAAGNERDLADLLHLAELLQQASGKLDGEQALIHFLREQRLRPEGDAKSRQQRLESDEARVRVVTVHKSKGLEYPLVFLPFFCDARPVGRKDDMVLRWHDSEGRPRQLLAPGADPQALLRAREAADEERLAEDMRKLYVALTRARHATWIGIDALPDLPRSAAGHLLGCTEGADDGTADDGGAAGPLAGTQRQAAAGGQKRASSQGGKDDLLRAARQALADRVAALVAAAPAGRIVVQPPPSAAQAVVMGQSASSGWRWKPAPALPAERWPAWWIASYSALELDRGGGQMDAAGMSLPGQQPDSALATGALRLAESPREDDWQEYLASEGAGIAADGLADPAVLLPGHSIHAFPRGPRPGTFLHGLLEWAGRQGFARLAAEPALLAGEIARRLHYQPDWQPWRAGVSAWLGEVVGARLGGPQVQQQTGGPLCLAGLQRYQVEMAFMLAAGAVDVQQLDAFVCRQTFAGAARPALLPGQLNGMLKGFIDLVFEHEGRYYVLDYKSNWLGPADQDYSQAGMQAAVLAHRYELQYLFYLLALHRLLKSRLPDYDYAQHMGGALYLFLRGIRAETGGLFCARPEASLIEALDAAFRGDARALCQAGEGA